MRRRWLVGACLLLLLLVGYWLFVDMIVGAAVERAASSALGVEAHVGFARISLREGDLRLSDVRIDDPPGFEAPHFLSVDSVEAEASPRALLDPVIVVPLISLEGVEVALERVGGHTNYGTILENMGDFEKGQSAPGETGGARRFVVKHLEIRDVTAHVEWNDLAARQTKLRLEIPLIELRDLGEGGGLTSAQLTNLVTKAILRSIARGGGQLPAELIAGLDAGLRGLAHLPGVVVEGAGRTLRSTTGAIGDRVLGAADAAGKAVERLLGGEHKD